MAITIEFMQSLCTESVYSYRVTHCISITILQSYTGKYHEFVAVCIVMSLQHE